jgi:hypothetical protein
VDSRPPPDGDPNGEQSVDSTVSGEVTRVEAVRYLQGAAGHAVGSLGFLFGGVLLVGLGAWGAGVVAVVVAYGVALHGLSIYVWDEFRTYLTALFDAREGDTDEGSTRTLTPHSVSTETKTEILAGFVMTVGLVVGFGAVLTALRVAGPQVTLYLTTGALALGDIGAVVWTYRVTTER